MPSAEAVKVGVRVRPLNTNEEGSDVCLRVNSEQSTVSITALPAVAGGQAARRKGGSEPSAQPGAVSSSFAFDHIFWSAGSATTGGGTDGPADASQADVYDAMGAPIVQHAVDGFNSCLFAYGQTGSGKTHTMLGEVDDSELMGVVPRICQDLFRTIQEREAAISGGGSRWTVEVGFVEIYNETLVDLLAKAKQKPAAGSSKPTTARGTRPPMSARGPGGPSAATAAAAATKPAVIRESATRGVFIENQTLRPVANAEDALSAIADASAARSVASTRMNQQSSRSHAVIQLHLVEIAVKSTASMSSPARGTAGGGVGGGGIVKRSVVNMVDLAGSERVKSTGAAGDQLEQAKYINLSLTTLGRVIDALANLSKKAAAGAGASSRVASLDTRPPYRESKLTFMLKSSLGGNSRTRMIAAVSPSAVQADESLSTLRYASRARDIVNTVQVNEDPLRRRIRDLESEMNALRTELQSAVTTAPAGGVPPDYVKSLEERIELLQADADMKVEQLATAAIEHERTVLDQLYDLAQTDEERERLARGKADLEIELAEAHRVLDAYEADLDRMRVAQSEREQRHLEELKARDEALEQLQRDLVTTQSRSTSHLERTIAMLNAEKAKKEGTIQQLTVELEALSAQLRATNEDHNAEDFARHSATHAELADQMVVLTDERSRIAAALDSATSASTSFQSAQQSQGQILRRTDIMTLIEREALSRQWLQTAAADELVQMQRAFATSGFAILDRCNAHVNDFLERQNQDLNEDLQLVVDRLHETRSHAERYALRSKELEEALAEAELRQAALEELVEVAASTPATSARGPSSARGGGADQHGRTPSGTPGAPPGSNSGGGFSSRNRASTGGGGIRSSTEVSPRVPPNQSGRPPLSARTDASSSGGGGADGEGGGAQPSQLLRRLRDLEAQLATSAMSLEAAKDENVKFRVALMTAEVEGFDVPTELLHPDYSGGGGFAADSFAAGTTPPHYATGPPNSEGVGGHSFSRGSSSAGCYTGGASPAHVPMGALDGTEPALDSSMMRLTHPA